MGAENISGTNKIIWENSGSFFYWNLDSNWQWSSGGSLSATDILDQEIYFNQDFNNDGNIDFIEVWGPKILIF